MKCYHFTKFLLLDKLPHALAACDGVLEHSLKDRAVIG